MLQKVVYFLDVKITLNNDYVYSNRLLFILLFFTISYPLYDFFYPAKYIFIFLIIYLHFFSRPSIAGLDIKYKDSYADIVVLLQHSDSSVYEQLKKQKFIIIDSYPSLDLITVILNKNNDFFLFQGSYRDMCLYMTYSFYPLNIIGINSHFNLYKNLNRIQYAND